MILLHTSIHYHTVSFQIRSYIETVTKIIKDFAGNMPQGQGLLQGLGPGPYQYLQPLVWTEFAFLHSFTIQGAVNTSAVRYLFDGVFWPNLKRCTLHLLPEDNIIFGAPRQVFTTVDYYEGPGCLMDLFPNAKVNIS